MENQDGFRASSEIICILSTLALPQETRETASLLRVDLNQFEITRWNTKYLQNDSSCILTRLRGLTETVTQIQEAVFH